MSGPDAAGAGQYRAPAGLLEKLMAAVRPEFRAGELVFDPRDPVFGGKPCLVPACERPAAGHGLCQGHRQRWAAAGRPDVREFAAATDPRWRKNAPLHMLPGTGMRIRRRAPQGPVRPARRRMGKSRDAVPAGLAGHAGGHGTRAAAGGLPDRQLRAVGRARKRLVPFAYRDLETARPAIGRGVHGTLGGR